MKVIKSLGTVFFVHVVIVSYFQYLKKIDPIHERVKPVESTVCGPSVST